MKKIIAYIIGFAVILIGIHFFIVNEVNKEEKVVSAYGNELEALDKNDSKSSYKQNLSEEESGGFAELSPPSPFNEMDLSDEGAKDWSSFFDGYSTTGVLVCDVNLDGRQDIYLCRNGNTRLRPTDENAVLQKEPKQQFNTLLLNLGNDAEGLPVFRQVKDLASYNNTYVKEELLVENFLYPRTGSRDQTRRIGRSSSTAIVADINADGLPDLIVGNILPGILGSHPKTQRALDQFARPIGHHAADTNLTHTDQSLYYPKNYKANDDINDSRPSERGEEAMGANSVFLNMGDKDGDGLPEWKDISKISGLEGKRNTTALLAADFDLDGDIDIFEANTMDMDYWPGEATNLAGAANQLYINQLAETGELKFIEKSAEMNVDGLYDENYPKPNYYKLKKYSFLPEAYAVALKNFEPYHPEFLEINGEKSEAGQISWSAVTQDVNLDGYPDIWVANDLGFLRLYINEEGKSFKLDNAHSRANKTGNWRSFAPADFNNDLNEDLFAGNIGGSAFSMAAPIPDLKNLFDPTISAAIRAQQFYNGNQNSMHALFNGSSGYKEEFENKVKLSTILPPDAFAANNTKVFASFGSGSELDFDQNSLDPFEFTLGVTPVDVQNDGRMDLYWVGSLQGRGGGEFPLMGTGPGRLLINATDNSNQLRFVDLTAEHHILNIKELDYSHLLDQGYISRKSPSLNWKNQGAETVSSADVSLWGFQGVDGMEQLSNHDLIQCSENGRAAIAADLNNDGFADIIVRNIGGYDSRSSNSKTLNEVVNGKTAAINPSGAHSLSTTNFEPGDTRVFINTYNRNNWLKVQLRDDSSESFNRDAIGARVALNNNQMQVLRSGGGSFASNQFGPLLFGLGEQTANTIKIYWPDKNRTVTEYPLPEYSKGLITISKTKGVISWEPKKNSMY